MSLSKIGKLTSAFSSFKNNPLDLTNMATALASVGNVDNAAKYLVKINKQNGNFLGENAMAVLLSKAYRSSGINQEMAMGSINNALANSSKFSMGGMLGSLSAVGTGIATMFESIAPVIIPLIIAAVAAKAGKMAWDNFATNTAAKKKYQTSSKAYQEAASERDSVQSEYDSNKERIQELRAKANRTVDESKELSNLQSQNDLLNSQLSVKNQIADTAQKQAALDAKTALEKGSYRSGGLLNMDYDSDLEHASQLIKEIKEAQSEKAEIEANRSSYDDSYWSDYQKEERDIAKYDKDITNKKSDLSDLMTTISDTSQDFWDEQGNLVDKSTKDTADKVKKLANDYTSITGVSDIDSKMNNLFARSQFKDVKDQLLDIGKKQGSKGIETKIDEIDGLKFALDDAGISVDDFTSELMAMADPDAKNLEGIKENLKDIFGEIKDADGNSLYDFFKDKSNKDNRIGPLETAKTEIEKNVNANTAAVSEIKTTISNIEKKVESATTKSDEAKNAVDILKQNMTSYDTQFEGINTDITDVKAAIEEIKKNPAAAEYDVTYENSIFTFLKDGEIQKSFKIEGGGGSSSDTTTITIERITNADAIFLLGSKAIIEYSFSSVDNTGDTTGAGTAVWKVGNTIVATNTAAQGNNSFDITEYLNVGANTIRLTITDSFGTLATKTWTVTIVEFKLESTFDDTLLYTNTDVVFRYTPYGNVNKTLHFILDSEDLGTVETQSSGRIMSYNIPKQEHGSHLLKVYMTATINNKEITSNTICKDIICVDPTNRTPIIGCAQQEFTAQQ